MTIQEDFTSKIDPERETIGKIYRDTQIRESAEGLKIGDINKEMVKGFVDELNEALMSNPFNDRPYYIQIAEKWDLQMKKALRRMINLTLYRPWPEDGTTVFWKNPKDGQVRFCWDIPHVSEMDNIMANPYLYPDQFPIVKAWKNFDMKKFGFWSRKIFNGETLKYETEWYTEENPELKDRIIQTV